MTTYTTFRFVSGAGRPADDHKEVTFMGGRDEAAGLFEAMYGWDPFEVVCHCCGPAYSAWEFEDD